MRWRTAGGPVCRPYGEQQALSRNGGRGNSLFPLSRCARHLPLIRGVVLPYDSQEYLLGLGRGGPWASRQDTHRERWLKKPRRMSGTAVAAIFANPGPSGPGGIAEATQILRAGNDTQLLRRASPVMGGQGVGEYGRVSAHPEPTPWRFFGSFLPGQKGTRPAGRNPPAARRRRNPLRKPPEAARRGRRALQGCRKKTISSPAPPGRQSSG